MDDHYFNDHHQQMARDFEVHGLNMKYHLSESAHLRAKGWKIMRWQWAFVVAAVLCAGLHLFVWPGWWWAVGVLFSVASFVCAALHYRVMRKVKAAHRAFDSLEPPASIRPVMTQIDAEIEAEEAAKKARRWGSA
jgi:hypothetical protein